MTRYVGGDGKVPCDLMLIGEGPGREEDKKLRPFVGQSGKELWRYLWQACHMTREEVYVTNLVKYRVPNDEDPTDEDIRRDANELAEELARVSPVFIATLGRHSSRMFLGDVDMEVVHGQPHIVRGCVIVPIIHPAAGLHSTEFQAQIAWDFQQLALAMAGKIPLEPPKDAHPNPSYTVNGGCSITQDAAVDTEGSKENPWCLSWSTEAGRGRVVREGPAFFKHIILHNAMHDLAVLRAMGARFETFDDTMEMAYLLEIEPQGLKALGKRHCGMEMQSYKDVVSGVGNKLAHEYLNKAIEWLSKRSKNESNE
jgi:uracil-DNA glycosylase family 4